MAELLTCWKCGACLAELLLPPRRRDECPECHADVHVCRMCEYFDPTVGQSCREPIADAVSDKERANFCGYFTARPGAHVAHGGAQADAARAELAALFGVPDTPETGATGVESASSGEGVPSEEAAARDKLNRLFGLGKKGS